MAEVGNRQLVEASPTLRGLQESLKGELQGLLGRHQGPLYYIMEYALGWRDQEGTLLPGPAPLLGRGCLCLLVCRAMGSDTQRALPAAGAVELLSQFSLVHDDIQNGSPEREGRSAVWWIWGPAQGINVGDGLHALARLSLFRLEDQGMPTPRVLQAARLLDQACLHLFEGQYQELLFQEQTQVLPGAYFSMAEKRAGALWSCAAGLGALSADADEEVLALCQQGGQKLGVAFQIQEDILELWSSAGGETPGGSLLNKRKSLPVIHALTSGEPQTRRELATLYLQRVLEPKDVVRIAELLDDAGSREYCRALVDTTAQEALETLAQAGIAGEALAEVRRLTQVVLGRDGDIGPRTDDSSA